MNYASGSNSVQLQQIIDLAYYKEQLSRTDGGMERYKIEQIIESLEEDLK